MPLILNDDNGNLLPQEVQDRVNTFINKLPNIPWFKPSKELKKEDVEKQAKFTLECFGIKASIEYRYLNTQNDWASASDSAMASALDSARASARASARDSARDSAMASAWASAWDSAWDSTWDSAWASARASARATTWASTWASARDSARASEEILIEGVDCEFNKKYPNGAFIQLFKLWEMGLYPVGVLEDTKTFVIYVPPCDISFPDEFK